MAPLQRRKAPVLLSAFVSLCCVALLITRRPTSIVVVSPNRLQTRSTPFATLEAVAAEVRAPNNSTSVESSTSSEGKTTASQLGRRIDSPHFSFDPSVLTPQFSEHLDYLCKKQATMKRFDKRDVSDCETETPECLFFQRYCDASSDRPYRKCCVEHRALRDLTLWVAKNLEENNVTYFLSTGSAIGVYRHAGTIIPWDTDVDIAVYPQDKARVRSIFANNKLHFFQKDPQGKGMVWIHASRDGRPRDGPHVEVFHEAVYTSHPEKLLPLQRCMYYGHPVYCPRREMLDVWFKSGWKKYAGAHFHSEGRCTVHERGVRTDVATC